MSCKKHFLFLSWSQHHWHRTVCACEDYRAQETDMWGRGTVNEYTSCQTEYFCSECGATKGVRFCGCDKSRGDQCRIRLAYLAGGSPRQDHELRAGH